MSNFWVRYPKLYRTYRYYYHRMFPRRRSPHEVAMSVFLGVFIGVLPTIGVAIPLTVLGCHLFRVPKIPGVLSSFIAIPPTLFFFFYPLGLTTGSLILKPVPIEFDFLEKFSELNLSNIGPTLGFLLKQAGGHFYAFFI